MAHCIWPVPVALVAPGTPGTTGIPGIPGAYVTRQLCASVVNDSLIADFVVFRGCFAVNITGIIALSL